MLLLAMPSVWRARRLAAVVAASSTIATFACGTSSSSQDGPGDDAGTDVGSSPDAARDAGHDAPAQIHDASYDAPATDARVPPDGGRIDAGGITVPSCASGERPVLLRNQCDVSVKVGLTPGSTGNCSGGTCAVGTCDTQNNVCYWPIPNLGPTNGLLAPGASLGVCFAAPVAGQGSQWSGNLASIVGCNANGQSCPQEPTTLAEFTFANQSTATPGTDFYDVSVINGMSTSMSMGPIAGTFAAKSGDAYWCGDPGASTASGGLPACSWNIQPTVSGVNQTAFARAVTLGGKGCSSDADCSGGSFCGLAQEGGSFVQNCGAPLGWWTADQICIVNGGFPAPYNCASTIQNANGSTSTFTQMLQCIGGQAASCYNPGATVDCCGCGSDATAWPAGNSGSCFSNNPKWQQLAEPWVAFFKRACPTAYVYPYDDATSSFTCSSPSNAKPVAYAVTFCP
jgi:hypothetical protein